MNEVEKYIKDNNIKGYLSSALDTDKIEEYIKNDKKEIKDFKNVVLVEDLEKNQRYFEIIETELI